ncbi:MAG TPA: hypothetical protein VGD37_23310 [Kofleriaceae bacterium]|jgi:hypothetical protein
MVAAMHHAVRLRRVGPGLRLCLALGVSLGAVAAAGSAHAQSAPAAAAAPAIGPPGPLGAPGVTPVAPPVGTAATAADRDGVFLAGSLGVGLISMADLRVGWVIGSRVSVFASLGAAALLVEEGGSARIVGGGARLWYGAGFAEARLVEVRESRACDFETVCRDSTAPLAIFGFGGELVHRRHVGVELRGDIITDGHNAQYMLALGVSVYR